MTENVTFAFLILDYVTQYDILYLYTFACPFCYLIFIKNGIVILGVYVLYLIIYLSGEIDFDCFLFIAIVKRTPVTMAEQVHVKWCFTFFKHMSRNGIAESLG